MVPIQPVNVWFNGVETPANRLDLVVVNDNLADSAQFFYCLISETDIPNPPTATSFPLTSIVRLTQGNLSMTTEEYANWNASPNINEAAFEWAAGKLNLTLV